MRGLFLLAAAFALGGCQSCKNDHPYVPAAAEAGVTTSDAGAARPVTGDAGTEAAVALAPGTTTWRGDGLTIEAGAQEIALVLARDFDGDGRKDALAILRPPLAERTPGAATGQLVFVHGGENRPPGVIAVGPTLGQWPACVATARLEKVGPRSAFMEIGSSCPKAVGSRAVAVVRLGPPAPVVAFDAVVLDPKDAPSLGVDVEIVDRDHDGVDDTVLRLTLEGAEARVAFFDRPAGPSRDPDEPEASLKAVFARSTKVKPKELPAVVDQVRALYRAICEEGGAPRLTQIRRASAVSCGPSKALEDAGIASVRALAQSDDVFGAFFAADLAQAPPATKTASRTAEIEKHLALVAPVETVKTVKTLSASVDAPSDHPEWGPLTFDAYGKLLVRSGKSVTSVDPETGDERTDAAPAWPSDVPSPDGKRRWTEAYQACESGTYRASFLVVESTSMVDAILPFAPRFGRPCTGHGEPVVAQPIAWGARGLEAIVAARPVLIKEDGGELKATLLDPFLDERAPQGSPRSAGGKIAVAVPNALLVRADAKWASLRSADFKPGELRACAVDDTGLRVACVRRGRVLLIQR